LSSRSTSEAIKARLASFTTEAVTELPTEAKMSAHRPDRDQKRRRAIGVDKSALVLPTARRIRDRDHVKSVAKQPCIICGRRPADAHHLRFAQAPALGRKVSDEFTVPLCRGHHREVHHCGDEADWWNKAGIDPTISARALWLKTHPLPSTSANLGGAHPTAAMDSGSVRQQNEANEEASSQ
jgi:hypothetical protein